MRRLGRLGVGLAAIIGLAAAAVPALAHDKVFPTAIQPTQISVTANDAFDAQFSGELSSPNPRCLPYRTVKLIYDFGTERRVVDVDVSSRNGAWSVKAHTASGPDAIFFKVVKKVLIGTAHHRHICGADRLHLAG